MGDETSVLTLIGDPSSVVAAMDEVMASLEDGETVMDALSVAADAVSATMDTLDASLSAVSGSLDATDAATTGLATSLDETAASLETTAASADATTASLQETTASEDEAAASAEGLGASLEAAQGGMLLMGMAAVMVGSKIIGMGMDAQTSFAQIQGLAGATQQQMQQYTGALEGMSVQFGTSLSDAANGLYYVISAGFSGSDALKVLSESMQAAAAGGVQMQVTASALTSILNAYGANASQSTYYTDLMTEAVVQGKQSFSDLASSIGIAAVTGHGAHFSFQEVAAAEADMTRSGMDAHRAVMDLDFMMRAIGTNAAHVATQAKSMGLAFNFSTFQSQDLIGRLQYLASITMGNADAFVHFAQNMPHASMQQLTEEAKSLGVKFDAAAYATMNASQRMDYLNQIASTAQGQFTKLVGGATGLVAAQILLTNSGSTYNQILGAMQHSQGATANAFEVSEQTMKAALDHVGAAFSVLGYLIVENIGPAIGGVLNWVADKFKVMADFFTQHTELLKPILVGLAVFVGVILVGAFTALAVSVITATWPFLLIAAGIAVLVAGFYYLYNNVAPVREAVQAVGGKLHDLWTIIQTQVWPAVQQFAQVVKGDLLQAWDAVWPILQTVGQYVGGFLYNAWQGLQIVIANFPGILSSVQGGLAPVVDFFKQLWGVLTTVGSYISSAVQPLLGALQLAWKALLPSLQQLWNTLSAQLMPIWQQIVSTVQGSLIPAWNSLKESVGQIIIMFQHLWQQLSPILLPVLEAIGAIIGGLLVLAIANLIGMLNGLISALGSIISGIIQFIGGFVQVIAGVLQVLVSIVTGIVNIIVDIFTGNWSHLGTDLKNMWSGIVSGIGNILGGLSNMIQGIWKMTIGAVFSFLGGFISGVIGFFQHLFDALVGHSIVVDLVNGIIHFFQSLPGKVLGLVGNLVGGILGFFGSLPGKIFSALGSLASGVASHIGDMVHGAVSNLMHLVPGVDQAMRLAKEKAEYHTLAMKEQTIKHAQEQNLGAISQLTREAQATEQQMSHAKTAAERHALEMKLKVIEHAIAMRVAHGHQLEMLRQQNEEKMKHLKTQMDQDSGNIVTNFLGHLADLAHEGLSKMQEFVTNLLSKLGDLKDQAVQKVQDLVSNITSFFTSLPGKALQWGQDMISGFINGIKNMAGSLGSAVSGIAGQIAGALHFSKPDFGPLADADQWMPDMLRLMAAGIQQNAHLVHEAIGGVASGMAQRVGLPAGASSLSSSSLAGSSQQATLLAQILQTLQRNGQPLVNVTPPNQAVGTVTQNFSNNFYGGTDFTNLVKQINQAMGWAIEVGNRGATGGVGW